MRPGISYTFKIVNFYKKCSLWSQGLQPLMYSIAAAASSSTGWKRSGSDVVYYKNNIRRRNSRRSFYTLAFTATFQHANDTVYFACAHPYSLDRGDKFFTTCTAKGWKMKSLCSTLGQRNIQQLSLKSKSSSGSGGGSSSGGRATVVVLARIHPGEPVGSWAVEGLINAVSKSTRARHCINWLVFPMLNPDGVAHGNSRCSFAGCDLNRQWQNPINFVLPEVYYVKKSVSRLVQKGVNVVAMIDLHGHSAKQVIYDV